MSGKTKNPRIDTLNALYNAINEIDKDYRLISIDINEDLLNELQKDCAELGMTLNDYVISLITYQFKRDKDK